MKIVFAARGVRAPGIEARARRGIASVLRRGGVRGDGELNVVWVTRRFLRGMGRRFRGADRYTDVISFRYAPLPPGRGRSKPAGEAGPPPFGDLFISPEQARLNAKAYGVPYAEECLRLCVHGALHLLGHTDYTPAPRARMWAVQERIVRACRAR